MKSEDSFWEEEFKRNYPASDFQEIGHYWWKDCYDEINKFIIKKITLSDKKEILECGCGSGNSSLRLAPFLKNVVLLDFSRSALGCARKIADYYGTYNVNFMEADIFNMPFERKRFHLVWNIGVIEHYDYNQAKKIIEEMMHITEKGGWVCVGLPNFLSLPIIKAKILSFKFLKPLTFWIKGYRLKDEKKYNPLEIEKIFIEVAKESNIEIEEIFSDYIGSVLPVETPKFIFNKINKSLTKFFPKFAFLFLIAVKIK